MTWLLLQRLATAACTVITGGEVFLPSGWAVATVVVDGDAIAAAGGAFPELRVTPDTATWKGQACVRVDASGQRVTAGLVEVSSRLGLVEIDLEPTTVDAEPGGDPIRPGVFAADAYNPLSSVIPIQRTGGLTSAVTAPGGGLVSGTSAWVDLVSDFDGALQKPHAAVHAALDAPSRVASVYRLRELLDDTRDYSENRAAWEKNQRRDYATHRLDLEAMVPVLKGEIPLVVSANRASDIRALVDLARSSRIRLVVSGGAEGWLVAEELAAAHVPVVVDPLVYGPGGFDQVRGRRDNPTLLTQAGVSVILSSFETHNARTLRQVAGNAVREGMSYDDALRAVTSSPADAFGMARHGRIAAGAVANLVVWSGDPFELSTRPVRMLVHGVDVPLLENRQEVLLQRYRTLAAPSR